MALQWGMSHPPESKSHLDNQPESGGNGTFPPGIKGLRGKVSILWPLRQEWPKEGDKPCFKEMQIPTTKKASPRHTGLRERERLPTSPAWTNGDPQPEKQKHGPRSLLRALSHGLSCSEDWEWQRRERMCPSVPLRPSTGLDKKENKAEFSQALAEETKLPSTLAA